MKTNNAAHTVGEYFAKLSRYIYPSGLN